ncbi:hypothetical protein V2W30_04785 [Streptomyces sp. Q6]|uniref:Uncharacterized protein n=1 Tax=Streptomyces citrinus TaxID=3118173 RepID=A0ACD5A699_9ACTN
MAWNVSFTARRRATSPVVLRRVGGCLLIEVRGAIGPAAEAHVGRVLHGAIRPGGTGVLVDCRHTPDLGPSGLSVMRLARILSARHGLAFGFVGETTYVPELPRGKTELRDSPGAEDVGPTAA